MVASSHGREWLILNKQSKRKSRVVKFLPQFKEQFDRLKSQAEELSQLLPEQHREIMSQVFYSSDSELELEFEAGACSLQELSYYLGQEGIYWFNNEEQLRHLAARVVQIYQVLAAHELFYGQLSPCQIEIYQIADQRELYPKLRAAHFVGRDWHEISACDEFYSRKKTHDFFSLEERARFELYQLGRSLQELMLVHVALKEKSLLQIFQFDRSQDEKADAVSSQMCADHALAKSRLAGAEGAPARQLQVLRQYYSAATVEMMEYLLGVRETQLPALVSWLSAQAQRTVEYEDICHKILVAQLAEATRAQVRDRSAGWAPLSDLCEMQFYELEYAEIRRVHEGAAPCLGPDAVLLQLELQVLVRLKKIDELRNRIEELGTGFEQQLKQENLSAFIEIQCMKLWAYSRYPILLKQQYAKLSHECQKSFGAASRQFTDLRLLIARIYLENGEQMQAREVLQELVDEIGRAPGAEEAAEESVPRVRLTREQELQALVLFGKCFDYFQEAGLAYLLRGKEIFESECETLSLGYAELQEFIGLIYKNVGKKDVSIQFYRASLSTIKASVGVQNMQYIRILKSLSAILDNVKKHEESVQCLEQAIMIYMELDAERCGMGQILSDLAYDYRNFFSYVDKIKSVWYEPGMQLYGVSAYKPALIRFEVAAWLCENAMQQEKAQLQDVLRQVGKKMQIAKIRCRACLAEQERQDLLRLYKSQKKDAQLDACDRDAVLLIIEITKIQMQSGLLYEAYESMRRCAAQMKADDDVRSIVIIYMGRMCELNAKLEMAEEYYKWGLKIALRVNVNYIIEFVKGLLYGVWRREAEIGCVEQDQAEVVRVIQSELGIADLLYGESHAEYVRVQERLWQELRALSASFQLRPMESFGVLCQIMTNNILDVFENQEFALRQHERLVQFAQKEMSDARVE